MSRTELPPDILRHVYKLAHRDPRSQVAMRAATRLVHELPAPSSKPYLAGRGLYQKIWNGLPQRLQWVLTSVDAFEDTYSFDQCHEIQNDFKALKNAYRQGHVTERQVDRTLQLLDGRLRYLENKHAAAVSAAKRNTGRMGRERRMAKYERQEEREDEYDGAAQMRRQRRVQARTARRAAA